MKLSTLAAGAVMALSLAAIGAPAHASVTVTLNETLDLSTPQDAGPFTAGWRGFGSFDPPFAFELAAGDSLDWTVQFLPGQSLTLVNPSTFWLYSYADQASGVNATGSLALLDADGNALFTSNTKSDEEDIIHFGQFFGPGDFASLPSTVTFSGLHYVGTVDSYVDPLVTSRHYAEPQVVFSADGARVTTGVPEPQAWALMIMGFAGLGLVMRSKRSPLAAA